MSETTLSKGLFNHKLIIRLMRPWSAVQHRLLRRRYGRLALETIEGAPLLVLPEVFNPALMRSGAFMARAIADLPPASWRGLSALDLGTGSGVGAVFAARRGARVTALDINPEAVRCAQINARLNYLEEYIQVLQGDLFDPLAGMQFDLILFNPPFYQGRPIDNLDYAWRGSGIFERFAAQLAGRLRPNGQALLVLSTHGDCDQLLRLLHEQEFDIDIARQKHYFNETITLYRVKRKAR
jgi:release factor glutamine methyltransferase